MIIPGDKKYLGKKTITSMSNEIWYNATMYYRNPDSRNVFIQKLTAQVAKLQKNHSFIYRRFKKYVSWSRFWMRFAGLNSFGRLAMRFAAWSVPSYKGRISLSHMNLRGYVESTAIIHHPDLRLGRHCFIGDRVVIFERKAGGRVEFGDRVQIYRDTVLETGSGGHITINHNSSIHLSCHLYAYLAPIDIGSGVMLAPNCALYSYDHSLAPDEPIRKLPLSTRGGIEIGDEAWLGFGVIVLSGVKIGKGAAIGAGSVVVDDIPENAIAVGNPARVVKMRADIE